MVQIGTGTILILTRADTQQRGEQPHHAANTIHKSELWPQCRVGRRRLQRSTYPAVLYVFGVEGTEEPSRLSPSLTSV